MNIQVKSKVDMVLHGKQINYGDILNYCILSGYLEINGANEAHVYISQLDIDRLFYIDYTKLIGLKFESQDLILYVDGGTQMTQVNICDNILILNHHPITKKFTLKIGDKLAQVDDLKFLISARSFDII